MEKWIHNQIIYQGRVVTLRVGEVEIDDGSHHLREVVEHSGGVAIAPWHDGRVLLARQYRVAVGAYVLELPAGRLEIGDTPEHRAAMELEEEIGYTPGRLVHAASCYCSPGFTTELDHIFLAFDLTPCTRRLEHDERIEIVEQTIDQVRQGLASRTYNDAKTIIGLRELLHRLD